MKRNRLYQADNLRALAAIAVVCIHVTANNLTSSNFHSFGFFINLVINQTFRFAVPVFFFLSGLGLALNYDYNAIKFYKRRILKALPGYFIWTTVYLAYYQKLSWGNLLSGLFLGSSAAQMWFIPIIFKMYLFFPALMKIKNKNLGLCIFFLVSLINLTAWEYFTPPSWIASAYNILLWIFFFYFGIWWAKSNCLVEKIVGKFWGIVVGAFVLSVESYIYKFDLEFSNNMSYGQIRPSVMIYTLLWVFWVMNRGIKFNNVLNVLSRHSYNIFLSHMLVLELLNRFYLFLNFNLLGTFYPFIIIPCVILGTLLISFISFYIKSSLNLLKREVTFSERI